MNFERPGTPAWDAKRMSDNLAQMRENQKYYNHNVARTQNEIHKANSFANYTAVLIVRIAIYLVVGTCAVKLIGDFMSK
jgi:hypothetical protein